MSEAVVPWAKADISWRIRPPFPVISLQGRHTPARGHLVQVGRPSGAMYGPIRLPTSFSATLPPRSVLRARACEVAPPLGSGSCWFSSGLPVPALLRLSCGFWLSTPSRRSEVVLLNLACVAGVPIRSRLRPRHVGVSMHRCPHCLPHLRIFHPGTKCRQASKQAWMYVSLVRAHILIDMPKTHRVDEFRKSCNGELVVSAFPPCAPIVMRCWR